MVAATLAVGLALAIALSVATPAGAAADTDQAARQLAERYAPVMRLQQQPEPCSSDGEAFGPMSVDAVLANPQIALRQVGADDPVVRWGPAAHDLYGLGDGFFLDFPGSALVPRCLYEKDFHRYTAARQPIVYAHVVSQDDRPGELALQYWFYWYFNDWNNKHESDWEGIQLVFPADTPAAALGVAPSAVGYAQHEGGERAHWDDDKLDRVGDHPVVYSSAGSHGSYYDSSLHLGRSPGEGFGCDDSTGPSVEVSPGVVLLPRAASSADDPFAWLGFQGRWGERHEGANNGPTGPAVKDRWTRPLDWQENLRASSVNVPTPGSQSGELVDSFCGVVGWGSNQLMAFSRSPLQVTVLLTALIALVVFLIRRTVWTATQPTPVVAARRSGQILRTSLSMFARAPWVFAAIGAMAVPIAVVAGVAAVLLEHLPVVGDVLQVAPTNGVSRLVVSLLSGGVAGAVTYTFVTAAVAVVMDDLSAGRKPSARRAVRVVRGRLGVLSAAFVVSAVVLLVLASTVVLALVALYLLVRVLFIAPVVMLEPTGSGRRAIARSFNRTRGRWWHTAITMALVAAATKLTPSVVGLLALVTTRPPFWVLSTLVVALDALLAPMLGIALTYLYGNAAARAVASPADGEASGAQPGATRPDTADDASLVGPVALRPGPESTEDV
jgi:hypothetical protein